MRKQRDTTEERHEQDMRELRGQQHGHVADVHRMRGCAVSWTLRQPRTRMIRQGHKQTHEAALRASRYVRRHAWQFHGAGVEAAVRDLQRICDWSPDCEVHGMVGGSVVMEKFEPYAWQFIVTGERMPEGSPFFQQVTGVDAYEFSEIRAAMEDMTRKAFTHEYPGVNIIGERWYPLYDFGGDDE